MLLLKSTEYALRLVLFMAGNPAGQYIRLREVAELCDISYFKLSKVAQNLIRAGLLESYTGPNGGVRLARAPSEIRLIEVLEAIEGGKILDGCVLGLDRCQQDGTCTLHAYWEQARQILTRMFQEKTVDELVDLESGNILGNSSAEVQSRLEKKPHQSKLP